MLECHPATMHAELGVIESQPLQSSKAWSKNPMVIYKSGESGERIGAWGKNVGGFAKGSDCYE